MCQKLNIEVELDNFICVNDATLAKQVTGDDSAGNVN
jgi:hypothetical protein